MDGMYITATSVPLRAVALTATSLVVGQITSYTLNVQIANALPAGSTMVVNIPVSSFGTSNIVFNSFYIDTTLVSGCTMTTISSMNIRL